MRKNGKMRVVILQSTFTPKLLSYEVKETNSKVGGKFSQKNSICFEWPQLSNQFEIVLFFARV